MQQPSPQPVFRRFMDYAPSILIILGVVFVFVVSVAAYLIIQAPNDYQHGATGKILYIHVPSAWIATLCYSGMTLCAIIVIFRASQPANLCLMTAAPIGAIFTLLTLVTGALWGQPAWGTWWVWDARLTSVLVLFVLYLALIALGAFQRHVQAAILTLFGFILVPIIKFSVSWWQTLHQPTSLWRAQGAAIEAAILQPLLFMALAFTLLFILLHLLSLRARLLYEQLQLYPALEVTKKPQQPESIPVTLPIST